MNKIYSKLEVFGDPNLNVSVFNQKRQIPVFYRNKYDFYDVQLFKQKYVLIESREQRINVKQFYAIINLIENEFKSLSIFYLEDLNQAQRMKMRENHISYIDNLGNFFIDPGYLNESNSRSKAKNDIKKLSVVAQLTFMYFLFQIKTAVSLKDISNYFNISEMHASRALNELNKLQLIEFSYSGKTNRAKLFRINPKINFFKEGSKHFETPIIKLVRTDEIVNLMVKSSDFALEKYTNLSGIKEERFALDKKSLKSIKTNSEGKYEVEVWRYSPNWFSKDGYVDAFSLCLIYKNDDDIRLQNELKELVGKQGWLME